MSHKEAVTALRASGFAVCRGLVDGLALEGLLGEYEGYVLPGKSSVEVRREQLEEVAGSGRIVHMFSMHEMPALAAVMADRRLIELASACLGGAGVRPIMLPELFDKPPHGNGSTATPPHQDNFYFKASDAGSIISFWIALDEADDASGTIRYVCESHLQGLRAHTLSTDSAVGGADLDPSEGLTGFMKHIHDYSDADRALERTAGQVHAGDVLLHHGLTIHSAPANTTCSRRRGLALNYVAESMAFGLASGFKQPALVFRFVDEGASLSAAAPQEPAKRAHAIGCIQCALVGWRGVKGGVSCTVLMDGATGELVVKLPDGPLRRQAIIALVKSGHLVHGAGFTRSLPLQLGDFAVPCYSQLSLQPRATRLPERYVGVWTLVREEVPPGTHVETSEQAMWLQTACGLFVDIRIPKALLADRAKAKAAGRTANTLCAASSSLAEQYSFAGVLSAHGTDSDIAVWHRLAEFHPFNGIADVGRMRWEGRCSDILVESSMPGHYRDYVETWHRFDESLGPANVAALQLLDNQDAPRDGFWVVAGSWFGLVKGRWRGDLLAKAVCKSLAHFLQHFADDMKVSHADAVSSSSYEASLGRVVSPGVLQITHDFAASREGTLLLDGKERQLRRDAADSQILVESWSGCRWRVQEMSGECSAFGPLKRVLST